MSCLVVGRIVAPQIYPCPHPQNLSICHVTWERGIKAVNQLTLRQAD